jgi:hypothetical protein
MHLGLATGDPMDKHLVGPFLCVLMFLVFIFGVYLAATAVGPVLAAPDAGGRLQAQWGDAKVAGLNGPQFVLLIGCLLICLAVYGALQALKGARAEVERDPDKSLVKEFIVHFAWWG